MSIDRALHRLLFERSFREAFLRDDVAALGLAAAEIELLSTVDKEQLRSAARLACDGILQRSHRGTGSLLDAFPRTIAAWQLAHPGESIGALADALAESPHFASYRALPTCAGGMSLEEIFFR